MNYTMPSYPQYPPYQDNYNRQRSPQAPTGLVWVQGEAAAKAYLVAPGNTIALWDSENTCIYLKSVDQSGMPMMRILDYTERVPARNDTPVNDYVTRDEYDKLAAQVAALMPKEVTENG